VKLVQIHRATLVDVDRLKGIGHELVKASCNEAARRQLDGRSLWRLSAATTECEKGATPAGRDRARQSGWQCGYTHEQGRGHAHNQRSARARSPLRHCRDPDVTAH
jgi:hypothetical protein